MLREVALLGFLSACAAKEPTERESEPPDVTEGDDSAACTEVPYYVDADQDGYGTGDELHDCDPVDAADVGGDCDDTDADVHPDRDDVCNGVDDDCDLDFDEDAATTTYYQDLDGDGFGTDALTVETCEPAPEGFVAASDDCDDTNAAIFPGALENWLDGIDDNCDGVRESEIPIDVAEATGNSWDAPTADTTELRVVAAYRSASMDGEITVTHEVPEAVALVLVSYAPVQWIVEETYPGTVQRIVVIGHNGGSSVMGPKGIDVESLTVDMPSGYDYDYDSDEARTIVEKAEVETGLELTSFHGTEHPWSFTIEPAANWMDVSAYPDCDKKPAGTALGEPDISALDSTACKDVLANSHICISTGGTTVSAYGLETGDSCTAVTTTSTFGYALNASIAWAGEYVYVCNENFGILTRVSLVTGTVEKAFVYCDGVTNYDGQLYIQEPSAWSTSGAPVYDTWENAQCDAPASYTDTTSNERVAIEDGVLYSTWHYTSELDWQVLGDTASGAIPLSDYKGWIDGFDVTADGWFVFMGDMGIEWHDLDGNRLDWLPGLAGVGLACATQ
jgi:hypothetical protein